MSQQDDDIETMSFKEFEDQEANEHNVRNPEEVN